MNGYCKNCKREFNIHSTGVDESFLFCPNCGKIDLVAYVTCCELRKLKGGEYPWCAKCGTRVENDKAI